jgi:outer membrane protein TolC
VARALIFSITSTLLLSGCFRPHAAGPGRSMSTWREVQTPASATAPASTGGGAGPAAQPGALSAEQAYQLALARSPMLAIEEARADVAEAQIGAAKQLENPELRLTNFRLEEAILGTPTMNVGLRVPVPRPGSINAKAQGARHAAEGAKASVEAARRQLRADIYRLFARMAAVRAQMALETDAEKLRAQRVDLVRARVDKAAATRLDLALADVAVAEAAGEGERLLGELRLVEDELRRLTGAGLEVTFHADASELQLVEVGGEVDALIERAFAARPELRAAQAKIAQAEAVAYLERNQAWPWIKWAQVSYLAGPGASPRTWAFSVNIDLPVLSWNRGKTRVAQALVRQREAEERAQVVAVAHDVAEAVARVERTAARVRALDEGLLAKLEVAAREAEAALAAGTLDPLKAADLEGRQIAARRQRLAALLEHRVALIELEAAIGGALGKQAARPKPVDVPEP